MISTILISGRWQVKKVFCRMVGKGGSPSHRNRGSLGTSQDSHSCCQYSSTQVGGNTPTQHWPLVFILTKSLNRSPTYSFTTEATGTSTYQPRFSRSHSWVTVVWGSIWLSGHGAAYFTQAALMRLCPHSHTEENSVFSSSSLEKEMQLWAARSHLGQQRATCTAVGPKVIIVEPNIPIA